MSHAVRFLHGHFEAFFLAYVWMNASILAALVGRPWLGAIGVVTVLPFLAGYALCVRAARK